MKKRYIDTSCLFFRRKEGIEVEVAYQYNDGYSENVLSFVNNVRTKDGEPMKLV